MNQSKSDRYIRFYAPILEALRNLGGSGTPKEVKAAVIAATNLSEEELNKVHRSGANVIENEIAWARNTLREAGLLDGSQYGVWRLTEKGANLTLTLEQARELRLKTHAERETRKADSTFSLLREAIGDAGKEIDIQSEQDGPTKLLAVLQGLSPSGFEKFCQRVLRESGFSEVHVSGRSGDGGIDGHGILQVNELVSFRVLFQCKRFRDRVGSEQIRNFRGAMQGRTDKGIFITTGSFTPSAEAEATREGTPPIELVNGERLVQLLERLQLGVVPRMVYDVDDRFFEEYR